MNWYSAILAFVVGSQVSSCMTNQEQHEQIKNLKEEIVQLREKKE